jgi:CDP-diacylglycerol---glycerol-3-phosphate 3-phosphatidyltransferase
MNLPNWITMGRIAAVPVMIVLIYFLSRAGDTAAARSLSMVSALVFTLAMCSDLVDGYLARKRGLTSTFGKFLDPLADKMIFLVALIMMIPMGRVPAWLVAIFFVREVTVTALRGIAVDEGIVIAASSWGKYKSAFVSCATVGILLHYPFFGVHWKMIGWIFMVPSLIFSLVSGLHYTVGFFRAASINEQTT